MVKPQAPVVVVGGFLWFSLLLLRSLSTVVFAVVRCSSCEVTIGLTHLWRRRPGKPLRGQNVQILPLPVLRSTVRVLLQAECDAGSRPCVEELLSLGCEVREKTTVVDV